MSAAVSLDETVAPFVRYADNATRRPWRLGPVSLLDYLLVHVRKGTMRVRADGLEVEAGCGAFCLVEPCRLLELEGDETVTPFLRFDIFYDNRRTDERDLHPSPRDLPRFVDLIQPRLSAIRGVRLPLILSPRSPDLFAATLLRAVSAWMEGDLVSRLEANNLAMELLVMILRDHTDLAVAPREKRLDWVDSFVASRLGEPLSLQDLADRARLSPSQFARLFKAQFGVPPHRYVLAMRVRRAQELLRDTDYPNERIAVDCGFADTYHFSKAFKRLTGVAPRAYRQASPGIGETWLQRTAV